MVHPRAECGFILENYFIPKLFTSVHETFSNAYPGKEVPNKTTIHHLLTAFWVDACLREGGRRFQHLLYSSSVTHSYQIKTKKQPVCHVTLTSLKCMNTAVIRVEF
jgi:hypothetical protein